MRFHPCSPLDAADVEEVLATVTAYVGRLLGHGGAGDGDDDGMLDEWADETPVLAGLAAASVQGRVALGSRAGARVRRRGDPWASATGPSGLGPCHARLNGCDLHAGLCVPADQRDRLERICRYALRPPVAHDHLQLTDDGQVRLALRHPWADATTHLLFGPVELLERLAALIPRPRINLILYHGALAPRAAWRSLVVQIRDRGQPQHRCGPGRGRRWPSRRGGLSPQTQLSVGGADASELGPGCARLSPVWRATHTDRVDRGPCGDCAHPATPRAPDRAARGPSRSRAADASLLLAISEFPN